MTTTEPLIEVVIPDGVDAWGLARLDDGSGDVLHLTPEAAMDLVNLLLDAIHDTAPGMGGGVRVAPGVEWFAHQPGDVPVWAMG